MDFPFWTLLITFMLPITIGIMIVIRILREMIELMAKHKTGQTLIMKDFGDIMLLLIFVTAIIGILLYLTGEQPEGFSIFEFLIEDTLPITWYVILMYGILVNLHLMFSRRSGNG